MGYYLARCAILRIYQYFYHDAAYSLDGVCVRCSECERAQYRWSVRLSVSYSRLLCRNCVRQLLSNYMTSNKEVE